MNLGRIFRVQLIQLVVDFKKQIENVRFNYVKIVNKDHKRFLEFLEEAKVRTLNNDDTKIIMI